MGPLFAYYVYFTVYLILAFLRLYLIKDLINMRAIDFIRNVYYKAVIVSFTAAFIPCVICYFQSDTIFRFFEICGISVVSTSLSVWILGFENNERQYILNLVKTKFIK